MKKIILVLVLFAAYCLLHTAYCYAANYFVSPTGNDANIGTDLNHTLRTIQKGVDKANPGDTVYVRAGTYSPVTITKSGSPGLPITLAGYGTERPLFEGNDTAPGDWNAFIWLEGSYLNLKQFEFSHSNGRGIGVYGGTTTAIQNISIDDVWVHHTKEAGIFMENANHFTVKNSRVWQTCRVNDKTNVWYVPEMWDAGIMGRNTLGPNGSGVDMQLRHNLIYESYGEGINIHGGMDQVTIADNTVYNTWSIGIYPLNSTHVLIERNLVYHTDDQRFFDGTAPGRGGIILSDEERPGSSDTATVINNIVMGYWVNFGYWYQYKFDVSGLKNTLIANNTFVNAHDSAGLSNGKNSVGWSYSNVWIDDSPNHTNVKFINNLVLQEDPQKRVIWVPNNPQLTLANNLYSSTPNDSYILKISDIVANPELTRSGMATSSAWFTLKATSPAIGHGLPLAEVTTDYANLSRLSPPTIGAYEYFTPPDYLKFQNFLLHFTSIFDFNTLVRGLFK